VIPFDQIGIIGLGLPAIILANSKSEKWRKRACLFGAAAQPFWFWTLIAHHQLFILAVTLVYAFSWFKGVWQWWIQPRLSCRPVESTVVP
jgi:hypothetical protein